MFFQDLCDKSPVVKHLDKLCDSSCDSSEMRMEVLLVKDSLIVFPDHGLSGVKQEYLTF